MNWTRLRTHLATEKTGYGLHDISGFCSREKVAALPAVTIFGDAIRLYDESVLRSSGFQHAERRTSTSVGIVRTCLELSRVAKLLDGRLKIEVERAITQITEADETDAQKITGWQLIRLQRLFLEYGIYVNEMSQTEHGMVLDGMNLRVGKTRIYPYVRFNDGAEWNFGSFYDGDNGGVQQVIVLDVSRVVGMVCRYVKLLKDDSNYEIAGMLRVRHSENEKLRAAPDGTGAALFRAFLSFSMGKFFYQALKKEEDQNPEKWYLKIVNSLMRAIATHEKVHALLHEAGVEVPNAEMDEALAMMGQIAYGPEEMALALLFASDNTPSAIHHRAAMRVIAGELSINGIPMDGRGIPKLLDLTARDMATAARKSLDSTFVLAAGRPFSDIVPIAELRGIASMDFVGPQHLPLLNALRHIPLD